MAMVAAGRGPARVRFGSHRPPRPSRLLALAAWARAPWLDRELAAGAEPWRTVLHSQRSLQITSTRARHAQARGLERLIERARTPARSLAATSQVRVDRAAILGACTHLQALADRLRDGRPVNTAGVAALRVLVTDGAGPLYNPLSGIGLGRALVAVRDALDVPD